MPPSSFSLSQLEQYLSKAAWILKGPIGASDFKAYIFPLLFFKRISDVYDEEYQSALEESDGDVDYAALPEFHRFVIPEGCHWNDVRATPTVATPASRNAASVRPAVGHRSRLSAGVTLPTSPASTYTTGAPGPRPTRRRAVAATRAPARLARAACRRQVVAPPPATCSSAAVGEIA